MALAHAPQRRLEPLLPPALPTERTRHAQGYHRSRPARTRPQTWAVTLDGLEIAARVQRIVLSYALGYESRGQLARHYVLSERAIQDILNGRSYRWLTLPIRERLDANGISIKRRGRQVAVREALERLARKASLMLAQPQLHLESARQEVAEDLYLLSGAWWEAEQP